MFLQHFRASTKVKIAIIFVIVFCGLTLSCLLRISHRPSTVIKATWPAWDYFEIINKPNPLDPKPDLQFRQYETYQSALDAFINNEAPMATLTIYEALIAYERLNQDVTILLLLDYTIGSDGVLAQPQFTHISQLKGASIGVEKNSISHYTLLKALERARLSVDDVTIVFGTTDTLYNQFKNGELDAISLYDPYLYTLTQETPRYNKLFSSKAIPKKICDVLIARRSWADSNKALIKTIQEKWYEKTKHPKPLRLLEKLHSYNSDNYLRHIEQQIYITGELENKVAFGTHQAPGYLNSAITDMSEFLKTQAILSPTFQITPSILWLPHEERENL